MKTKEFYSKETNWGIHTVTAGFGKHIGKFIAQSRGWGGTPGYFRIFETEGEARAYVDHQTRPLPKSDIISF